MSDEKEQLQAITEIRSMMERSSRFLSLSGLSGVFAGIFALAGAGAAWFRMEEWLLFSDPANAYRGGGEQTSSFMTFIFMDALIVLVASLSFGLFFTARKAKKQGLKIWDGTSRRMAISLFLPLAAGGIFSLELLHFGLAVLIAPVTLLFYGLALLNASKYTINDIRYLGITEIVLGLVATAYHGTGLLFWAIGFGVMHIVYGAAIWYKYERN